MGGISVLFLSGLILGIYLFIVSMIAIIIFYILVSYIFESLAITSMSKNLKYKNVYTGWIPIYNKYILGRIAGSKPLGITLLITSLISTVTFVSLFILKEPLSVIVVILLLSVIITFILDIILSHKIFSKYMDKYKDIMTILSILSLGFLRPILLFIIRSKKEKS